MPTLPSDTEPCGDCSGLGRTDEDGTCPTCSGAGVLRSEHDADGEAPTPPRGPGRPPLDGIGAARRLPRGGLTPAQVEALAALCDRWGCSESEAVRRAIQYATDHE